MDEATQLGLPRGRNINGLWEEAAFANSLIALLHGNYEEAAAPMEEIAISAEELGNRTGYLWARVNLGYIALRAGNLAEARTIFAVFTLEGQAGLSVAVGKLEHAARLVGWADGARARILNPRPFLEQTNVDQVVAACLATMGAVPFWDAYHAGKKMSLDEAVAYSLAGG